MKPVCWKTANDVPVQAVRFIIPSFISHSSRIVKVRVDIRHLFPCAGELQIERADR